jgi:hypothetical protein
VFRVFRLIVLEVRFENLHLIAAHIRFLGAYQARLPNVPSRRVACSVDAGDAIKAQRKTVVPRPYSHQCF